jgi:GNAT superfamily N-acetyltransferase
MLESLNTFALLDMGCIAETLASDPIGTAYLLADLDPPYFQHTRWFGAGPAVKELKSVVMVYTALEVPALLTFGGKAGFSRILEDYRDELPDTCHGMIWPDHEDPIEKFYTGRRIRRMNRMGLGRNDFRPCHGGPDAEPMKRGDLEDLTALMEHYPGNYFEPAMFSEDLYYGIRVHGRLVSAGGIHTYSATHRVAALGNIVTHGDHRRQGLALRCTSSLLEKLFEKVDHVALNVEAGNAPALNCYRRLGFASRLTYTEGLYTKKEHP